MSIQRSVRKFTHLFPGEHYALVRPIRDDLRRSIVEVPRRARREDTRRVKAVKRKVGKRTMKQLTKDTHKGRATKGTSTPRRAPATMHARPPGAKALRTVSGAHPPHVLKDAGIKAHRPRVLTPHPPRLYHVLPIQRIYQHLKEHRL